jgi:hypothetical protein
MTSQINPNNIDGTFPVAGQDNSSQGFRDNFTNTKNNFQYAYNEITALQANAVLKGQTNNLGGSIISNAAFSGIREVNFNHGTVTGGAITYTFANGSYQILELGSTVTVTFDTDFAAITDKTITVKLEVFVPDVKWALVWPASVNRNLYSIANVSGQTVRFTQTGRYIFQLTTSDGGTSWNITDLTRTRNVIQGNLSLQANVANVATTGITLTVDNSGPGGSVFGQISANSIVVNTLTTSGNNATYSGNVQANNLIANTGIYGNILTAIQSNITLLGTQTSLSVSGNANIGNLTVSSMLDVCGTYAETGIQFISNAVDGASTNINSNISVVILQPNTVIASYTLVFPSTPTNGRFLRITFANTITSLTMTSGGDTINGKFTTGNANVGGTWLYQSSSSTWFKMS